ncbi:hypothetical protein [Marinobacterium stanieri]|uniref:hypothetical protein n=1 Tax=Marinobacterium stanieri TaxID=49186 RepID=UPI003A952E1E
MSKYITIGIEFDSTEGQTPKDIPMLGEEFCGGTVYAAAGYDVFAVTEIAEEAFDSHDHDEIDKAREKIDQLINEQCKR